MKNKKYLIAIIPVLVLIFLYLGGVVMYSNSFLPNTYINNTNVGGMSVAKVENKLQSDSLSKTITLIKNDDSTEEIKLTDIDYTCEYETDISKIKNAQSPFGWVLAFFGKDEYNAKLKTSYNEEALNNAIDSLKCVTNEAIQDPVDAHIEQTDSGFIVVDAIDGNRLDVDKLKTVIKENLNNGIYEINLSDQNCYLTANIKADDETITATMEKIEKFNDLVITLDMTDATEVIDFSVFKNWITNEDGSVNLDEKGNVVLNQDLITDWVTDDLRIKYNTFGTTRKFNATDIGEITVGGSEYDSYGFQVKIDKTVAVIVDAINGGESVTVKPVWNIPALCRGENDIGNTYIEIDLTRQHMWYYVDGQLYLDTDIKSGKPTPERETPTGLFRIWHKEKDRYLTGPGYRSHVDFWMPFTWTGCGIHDASWTNQFGGEYYKTSGSHGCINTPYNMVSKLYDKVEYDTPVVVYKS